MCLIDEVIDWANEEDPKNIKKWEGFLERYLKRYGWNKAAIDDFISMGNSGFNYKTLHITTTVQDFYDDVYYCSDRMCMDRLLRCHIQYRTINMKYDL